MSRAEFAARRRAILDDAHERIRPQVESGLQRWPQAGWSDDIVEAGGAVWRDTFQDEHPDGPIDGAAFSGFIDVLGESLDRTSDPGEDPTDGRIDRLARWVASYAVNDATMAAALAEPDARPTLTWVTMGDTRVRDLHRGLDGVTIAAGETFDVGGFALHVPGEPVGPPEVWIECRCVARPGIGETVDTDETAAITTEFAATEQDPPEEEDERDPEGEFPDGFALSTPWYGVLAPEGVESGDRRKMAEGSLVWRNLPLPLRYQESDTGGHDGAVIVGRIDGIERVGNEMRAWGVFDASDRGDEVVRMVAEQMLRGVSVDLDDVVMSVVNRKTGEEFDFENDDVEDHLFVVDEGRIAAATLVAIPAFQEAFVSLGTWDDAALAASGEFAPGTHDGPGWLTNPQDTQRLRNYWTKGKGAAKIRWGVPGDFDRCRRQLAKYVSPAYLAGTCANLHKVALGFWPGEHRGKHSLEGAAPAFALTAACDSCPDALVASGSLPPIEWFQDPHLDGPTPLTITPEGRIYGHAAAWGTCHTGYPGVCVTPPQGGDYGRFMLGLTDTTGGPVATGNVVMETFHAAHSVPPGTAQAYYANTGAVAARVAVGEDEHGIWVAGVLREDLTEAQRATLQGSTLSGDWRRFSPAGPRDLVGILVVNMPGFPIPRTSAAITGGRQHALTAAGVLHPPSREVDPAFAARAQAARDAVAKAGRVTHAAQARRALALTR